MRSEPIAKDFESGSLGWVARAAMLLTLLGAAACSGVADDTAGEVSEAGEENVAKSEEALVAPGYLAVWQAGSGAQWWRSGMYSGELVAEDKRMFANGFRIRTIDVYNHTASCGLGCTETRHQYTAVWEPGTGAQWWHAGMSSSTFISKANSYYTQGLRVTALAVSSTGSITAVWRPGDGAERVHAGISSASLKSNDTTYWNQGFQMEQLVGYDGKYYAKWGPKHSGSFWRTGLSPTSVSSEDRAFFNQGYRIASLDVRGDKYVGIWNNSLGNGAQWWNSGLTPTEMRRLDQERFAQGLRLKVLRVRKYEYPEANNPEKPNMSGMNPTPPAGNTCSVWATIEITECYNVDGSASSAVDSGQITNMACASNTTNAQSAAKLGLQQAGFCLSTSPTANCCTYRYR